MLNPIYDPFNKKIEDLNSSDLAKLSTVAEGWFVEYKSRLPLPRNLAKSMSSFANHYGGWLFIGIKADDGNTNCPEEFVGIDSNQVSSVVESLRNAVKDILSSPPYYQHAILDGPENRIGLNRGRSIVAVAIPPGANTPYVHNNGRIYRRIADSSDPRHINDPITLDLLANKREAAYRRLYDFISQEPLLSDGEKETTYVNLYLMPDPMGTASFRRNLSFDRFVEFMTDPSDLPSSIPFESFSTFSDGFVARQIGFNDPYNLCLTWTAFSDGSSWVSVPLSSVRADILEEKEWLKGYDHGQDFLELIRSGKHSSSFVLDLNLLLSFVLAVCVQNKELLIKSELPETAYAKATIHNMWRRIPFLDTHGYISFSEKHGLPVIQFDNQETPPGRQFDDLRQIPDSRYYKDVSKDSQSRDAVIGTTIGVDLIEAFGLPSKLLKDSPIDWFQAADRAKTVGKRRQEIYS